MKVGKKAKIGLYVLGGLLAIFVLAHTPPIPSASTSALGMPSSSCALRERGHDFLYQNRAELALLVYPAAVVVALSDDN